MEESGAVEEVLRRNGSVQVAMREDDKLQAQVALCMCTSGCEAAYFVADAEEGGDILPKLANVAGT